MKRQWCDTCRGESEGAGDLHKCSTCSRKFHIECESSLMRLKGDRSKWSCTYCSVDDDTKEQKSTKKSAKTATSRVRALHKQICTRSAGFYLAEEEHLAPFVPADRLHSLIRGKSDVPADFPNVKRVARRQPFITAELRPYQVEGVNWILNKYDMGVGGILADEMGLGKTLQTIAFLCALKEAGLQGPHLVVTPLAVLQNWHNEIKRFAPGLTAVKVHGTMAERDRILSMPDVLAGTFDVYLTTYDMILSEEAFFTETFLFHTITIDEGHRLKNNECKLSASLARISAPFRLLLTGTPLQNNLNELWSVMHYVLPRALEGSKSLFENACNVHDGHMDRAVVTQARALLESIMLRRVKSEVEKELKDKVQFVLKVPLSDLQREWYQIFLKQDQNLEGLVTRTQLMSKIIQLQKIINHPKTVLYSLDRQREQARTLVRRAEGAESFAMPECLKPQSAETKQKEAQLRALKGKTLIESCGKLQLLDRLLTRVLAAGSRVLLFSQYTLTLDVLCEYCAQRFGPESQGYLRLDGATNRIKREMDVRTFNMPGSKIPIYLISTTAGGMGINLATADVVVLYDTGWNPQVDLQAQDRAHRIGQTKQVKVYRLVAESTMEERILARARQKLVLDAMVIKKASESSALTSAVGDEESGEGLETLDLDQLWSFLYHGAEKVFDPTIPTKHSLSVKDLDDIIDSGRLLSSLPEDPDPDPGPSAPLPTAAPAPAAGAEAAADRACASSSVGLAQTAPPLLHTPTNAKPPVSPQQLSALPTPATHRTSLIAPGPEPGKEGAVGSVPLVVPPVQPPAHGSVSAAYFAALARYRQGANMTLAAAAASQPIPWAPLAALPGVHAPPGGMPALGGWGALGAGPAPVRQAPQPAPVTRVGRGGREIKPVKRFSPKITQGARVGKKRKLVYESECFNCGDGGELMECGFCPKVYHATKECAGVSRVPKGQWQCPWHACWECERKSSSAGGILFHCLTCPTAYCFDCCPDRYSMNQTKGKEHLRMTNRLEDMGVSTKSWLFFSCDDCAAAREEERKKKREAMRLFSLASRASFSSFSASAPSASVRAEKEPEVENAEEEMVVIEEDEEVEAEIEEEKETDDDAEMEEGRESTTSEEEQWTEELEEDDLQN